MVIGIDPGLTGGIAVLLDGNPVYTVVMPVIGNVLDLPRLIQHLRFPPGDMKLFAPPLPAVYLERAQPMPKQGSVSTFKFGRTMGQIEGVVTALGLPLVLVPPQRWQKVMHAGIERTLGPKERSAMAVARLYPHLDLRASPRCRKAHEGLVDALLLGAWGARQGGPSQSP